MSEIRFYHLQRASLEDTLPVILERAYSRGERTLVLHTTREGTLRQEVTVTAEDEER